MERTATAPTQRKEEGRLFINSFNPTAVLTVRTRLRQVLHTHQGRDKIFKVVQYFIRLLLWARNTKSTAYFGQRSGAVVNSGDMFLKTLNQLTDARRMMRIGRFVAEFVKMRATLIKCSEIQLAPAGYHHWLQLQMLVDIVARALMCVKSVMEDVVFAVQSGMLNADLEPKLLRVASKLAIPVLLIDLYLNTMRLAQGIVDARYAQPETDMSPGTLLPNVPSGDSVHGLDASGRRRKSVSMSPSMDKFPEKVTNGKPLSPTEAAATQVSQMQSSFRQGCSPTTATPTATPTASDSQGTFSLYATYQKVDKLRKRVNTSASPAPSLPQIKRSTSNLADLMATSNRTSTPAPASTGNTRPTSRSPPPDAAWKPLRTTTSPPAAIDTFLTSSGSDDSSNELTDLPATPPGPKGILQTKTVQSKITGPSFPVAPLSATFVTGPTESIVKSPDTIVSYDQCARKPNRVTLNTSTTNASTPSVDTTRNSSFADGLDRGHTATPLAVRVGGNENSVVAVDLQAPESEELIVDTYLQLIMTDYEIHWVCVTQFKLILDLTVTLARVMDVTAYEGFFAACGLTSGLMSVYRVFFYGR